MSWLTLEEERRETVTCHPLHGRFPGGLVIVCEASSRKLVLSM